MKNTLKRILTYRLSFIKIVIDKYTFYFYYNINKNVQKGSSRMLKLAPVFTDHMVLQRNKEIAIWGECDKKIVTVFLEGFMPVETETHGNKFMVYLSEMPAGGPYKLNVSDGEESIQLCDIMIGEVWLAGGQSNMELELQNCANGQNIVDNAIPESVRFYYTPKYAYECEESRIAFDKSCWELFTPENCKKWSAVGYFFAKELSEKLGVVVGILGCNWGGTSASCWMDRNSLESNPTISCYIKEYDEITKDMNEEAYTKLYDEYLIYQSIFDKKVSEYYKTAKNPNWEEAITLFGENKYPGPMGPKNFTRPCGLYETMLKKVCPYTINGFIFYQGEEDDIRPYIYKDLLKAMIECWRRDWNSPNLPFIMVQLPIFKNEGEDDYKNWPFIREAQIETASEINNVSTAVCLELGEKYNIHPLNKKTVGERLALQALHTVYGIIDENEANAPIMKNSRIEDDSMIIEISNALDYKVTMDTIINGFEVASEDKIYYPAQCKLDEYTIILHSDNVQKPLYARYFWTNYADVMIFGKNGLPLSPFRTSHDDGAKANGSRNGDLKI